MYTDCLFSNYISFRGVNVQGFQTILINVLVLIFLPLSVIAADQVDTVPNADIEVDGDIAAQQDEGIMIRQTQPIAGFEELTVAGQKIKATFLEETLGEPHGAIVLLHDQGEKFESMGVVTPLRHEMLQYGWSTLTVSLEYPFTPNIFLAISPEDKTSIDPVESKESATNTDLAKTDEVNNDEPKVLPPISNQQRIDAAIAFLKTKDIERIILLGHGKGGIVAINELSTISTAISALILVGTPALSNSDEFKTFELPIMDIYGEQDLEGVSSAVKHRKVVMKRVDNIQYTSREIIGGNHVYYGLEPTLVSTVRGWLYTTFVKQEKSE